MGLQNLRAGAPLSCGECEIGGRTFYRRLHACSPDQLTSCRSAIRSMPENRLVFRQGEVPAQIFSVYSGWLCRLREMPGGKKQILNFIIPGDVITYSSLFMPGQPLSYTIRTITDVQLCEFEMAGFRRMLHEKPEFLEPYYQDLAEYLEGVTCRLADLGQQSAKARLARWFLDLYRRHEKKSLLVNGGFDLPVSQELMANKLGMTKAYLNRAIGELRREGSISLEAGHLCVHDLRRLESFSEAP